MSDREVPRNEASILRDLDYRLRQIEQGRNRGPGASFGVPFRVGNHEFVEVNGDLAVADVGSGVATALGAASGAPTIVNNTIIAGGVGMVPGSVVQISPGNQIYPTSADYAIAWNNVLRGPAFLTGYKFQLPIGGQAGWYQVTASAKWAVNGTGVRIIYIRGNGVTVYSADSRVPDGTSYCYQNVVDQIYMGSPTDYIEIMGFQSSGANLTMLYARASFMLVST